MEFRTFTAGPDDDGRRFDRVLKKMFPQSPLSEIYRLLRKGFVKLNGKKADENARVKEGDIITAACFVCKTDVPNNACASKEASFDTIFRNNYIWIINKPYVIPVQPTESGTQSISSLVAESAGSLAGTSLSFTAAPLHRLDKYTTGLLVISQNLLGAQWFSAALASEKPRLIKKTYIGIVQGELKDNCSWKDIILSENETSATRKFHTVTVCQQGSDDMAETNAFPLAHGAIAGSSVTLVQFDILTGKKHQIRAQSSYHGYPLWNDTAYGAKKQQQSSQEYQFRAFYLHALRLECDDENPIGLPHELIAPPPPDFIFFLTSALIKWNGSLIL